MITTTIEDLLNLDIKAGFEFEFIAPVYFPWTILAQPSLPYQDLKEEHKQILSWIPDNIKSNLVLAQNPKISKQLQKEGKTVLLPDMSVARNATLGWELVTQPLPIRDAYLQLQQLLVSLSKSPMRCANSTGLHIGLSLPGRSLLKDLNNLKLICLLDEDAIYKFMPSRKGNRFVINYKDFTNPKAKLPELLSQVSNKSLVDIDMHFKENYVPRATKRVLYDKNYVVNFLPLLNNYIEFRILGGEDYAMKHELIMEAFNHFCTILISSLGDDHAFEYKTKLEELVKKCTKPVKQGIF